MISDYVRKDKHMINYSVEIKSADKYKVTESEESLKLLTILITTQLMS